MTPTQRRAVLPALLIVAHPLLLSAWIGSRFVDAPYLVEFSYLIDVLFSAVLAFRLRAWWVRRAPPQPPERLLQTIDGFKTRFMMPWMFLSTLGGALSGTILSTCSLGVGLAIAIALSSERFGPASSSPGDHAAVAAVVLMTHALLQGALMANFALVQAWVTRRRSVRDVQLVGRVLRVGNGSAFMGPGVVMDVDHAAPHLQIRGPGAALVVEESPEVLGWLADTLAPLCVPEEGPVGDDVGRLKAMTAGARQQVRDRG